MTGVFRILKCSCGKQTYSQKGAIKGTCSCGQTPRALPSWYIGYRVAGRPVVEAVSPDKRTAQSLLRKRLTEIKEQKYFPGQSATTLRAAIESFRSWAAQSNVAPKTKLMYDNSLLAIARYFSDNTSVEDIGKERLEGFKAQRAREVSNSSVNRELATLKRMCSALDIPNRAIERVKLLPENAPRERTLSQGEMEALLDECKNPRLFRAVTIALQTGLRKDGVYTLNLRTDIDLEYRFIRKTTKGKKRVAIPLTDLLYDLLAEIKAEGLSDWVIPSPEDPAQHVSLNSDLGFPEACDRAGIKDFRFHDLRHSFASLFVVKTGDIKSAGNILGHSKVSTTERYVQIPDSHLTEQMKKFSS